MCVCGSKLHEGFCLLKYPISSRVPMYVKNFRRVQKILPLVVALKFCNWFHSESQNTYTLSPSPFMTRTKVSSSQKVPWDMAKIGFQHPVGLFILSLHTLYTIPLCYYSPQQQLLVPHTATMVSLYAQLRCYYHCCCML